MSQMADGRALRQRADGGNVVRAVESRLRTMFAALNRIGVSDAEREYARQRTDRAIELDRNATIVRSVGL